MSSDWELSSKYSERDGWRFMLSMYTHINAAGLRNLIRVLEIAATIPSPAPTAMREFAAAVLGPEEPVDAAPQPVAEPFERTVGLDTINALVPAGTKLIVIDPLARALAGDADETAPVAETRPPENPQSPAPLPPPVDEKPPAPQKSSTPAVPIGWDWSKERIKFLRENWPTDMSAAQIEAELRMLPGAQGSSGAVAVKAANIGLRRPSKATPTAAKVNGDAREIKPTSADFEQIEQWAAVRGIDFSRAGIEAVNKKRTDLGLPAFALRHGART